MAQRDLHAASIDGDRADEGASTDDLERDTWLREALTQLAPRCRELLEALYLESPGLSYLETAARLDMSLGSVGPTRSRCLKQLRDLLAAEPGADT
jgi:RNA polymerase sigma factor (sigma-70 family)